MRRRLFTMAWALSLVMSAAVVALWVRSHFRQDYLARTIDVVEEHDELEREWFARSNLGQLYLTHTWKQKRYDAPAPELKNQRHWLHIAIAPDRNPKGPVYFSQNFDTPASRNRSRGFESKIMSAGHFTMHAWWPNGWSNRSVWVISFPHWPVAVMFLILPGIAFWRRRKARRRQRLIENRRCPQCGYDVRASGQYCPECGKPVEAARVGVSS